MECNRGHIIYKTVPLLTHCTCSIPQRMNSTAKFIPQPAREFMFEAIFCKTVFMLPTNFLRNRSFNSLISKCADFSKEKCLYLSSLTPLEHGHAAPSPLQHNPGTATPFFCFSASKLKWVLPALHRNTNIHHLSTVRKPFPRSVPSHCHKQ